MEQMIRKETRFNVVNHWCLAGSCILLGITGYGFLFRIEAIGWVFGGFNAMRVIHSWLGVLFTLALFVSMLAYLKEDLRFGADDLRWIRVAGGYLWRTTEVPPMGKHNTGQKLFYIGLVLAGVGISLTGFLLWLMPQNKQVLTWSHLLHNLCFLFFVVAIPAHIYLGTFANPGSFRIMIYGTVPYEWAKKQYPKWIAELENHRAPHQSH